MFQSRFCEILHVCVRRMRTLTKQFSCQALATVSPSSSLMKTNREEEVDHFLLWDPAVAPRIMKSMDDLKLRVEAFVVIADLVRTDAWGRFVLDLASHEGAWAVFHNAAKLRDDRECDKKVLVDFFSLPAWLRSFEFSGN
ncbi:hypothetical protein AAMO2058_000754200 [Amorphochlora amoebiformis]